MHNSLAPADFRQGRDVSLPEDNIELGMERIQTRHSLLSQFGVAFGVHDSELRMERIQVRHSLLSQFDVAFRVHNSGLRKQPMAARFIRLILNPV